MEGVDLYYNMVREVNPKYAFIHTLVNTTSSVHLAHMLTR